MAIKTYLYAIYSPSFFLFKSYLNTELLYQTHFFNQTTTYIMKHSSLLSILTLLVCLLSFSNAQATTYTFTALTGNWDVPTNWEDGIVPPEPIPSGSTVLIPLGNLVTVPVGYTVTNNGIILITETDGITSEGKLAIHGVLNNNARILTGRMEINGLYNHNAGATIEQGGTVYVRPGGIFNVVGTLVCICSLGNLGTLNVLSSGTLDIRGTYNNIGTLVNNGTFIGPISMWDNQVSLIKGSGTFTSNFVGVASTASTIAPGNSAGCLTFSNNFNNSAASHVLKIDINGTNPCTGYDKLIVGGTATIGGTLEVTFGFTPTTSQNFQIIQAAAISGTFSTVNISPPSISANYSSGFLSVSAVLNTELTQFTTQLKENTVHLDWQTASEYNNKGFEIQRSFDGNVWTSIGFVAGSGSSNKVHFYAFDDLKPAFGKNYYRLQQIEKDGKSTFSAIKSIEYSDKRHKVNIYPNPAKGDVTIQLPIEEREQKVQVELFDTLGNCLRIQELEVSSHKATLKLDNLASGFYQMRLTSGAKVWVNRLVIER